MFNAMFLARKRILLEQRIGELQVILPNILIEGLGQMHFNGRGSSQDNYFLREHMY